MIMLRFPVHVVIIEILLCLMIRLTAGHREHKVHNITLYPDKHSWCHVLPIKQVISNTGYKSIEIDNNVCVGACFSYSIPQTEPSDPGEVIVPYCDSCQPSDIEWALVELDGDRYGETTSEHLTKSVQIINNCSCTSCEKDEYLRQKLLGYTADEDSLQHQNDMPDLLDVVQNRNDNQELPIGPLDEQKKDLKSLLNHHIVTLLQNIQLNNLEKDKEELVDALRIVQGQSQNNISEQTLAMFVEILNDENIQLDIPKLRDILTKFEQSKIYEEQRKTMLLLNQNNEIDGDGDDEVIDNINDNQFQPEYNDNDDEPNDNMERFSAGYLKKSYVGMRLQQDQDRQNSDPDYDQINQELQNNDPDDELPRMQIDNDISSPAGMNLHQHRVHHHHHHHHHHHPNHHHKQFTDDDDEPDLELVPNQSIIDLSSDEIEIEGNPEQIVKTHHQMHHQQQQHNHHRIGENIHDHGHLTRGPHNSLVLTPDNNESVGTPGKVSVGTPIKGPVGTSVRASFGTPVRGSVGTPGKVSVGTPVKGTVGAPVKGSVGTPVKASVAGQQNQLHEKLDVNANELKPNHAGTLLTYSSHLSSPLIHDNKNDSLK